MRLRSLYVLTALLAVTAVSAIATSSASAWIWSNKARTDHNYAGVVFHPDGDCFDIYDNADNGKRARVTWNYVGIKDKPKFLYSKGKQVTRCLNLKEPAEIYFKIKGHSESGYLLYDSGIARWRTYG